MIDDSLKFKDFKTDNNKYTHNILQKPVVFFFKEFELILDKPESSNYYLLHYDQEFSKISRYLCLFASRTFRF